MEPIIYSSADTGAPQIGVAAGDINKVIKACLITGYGDKAAAGWEMLSEDLDAKTLAVRSKNIKSIKSVFVFNDSNAATLPIIKGYLDWDDSALLPIDEYGRRTGLKMRAPNQSWVVVADDCFCWLWVSKDSSATYGVTQAFGDLISIVPSSAASGIIGYTSEVYVIESLNITDFVTSQGIAYLAPQPYKTFYPTALGGKSDDYKSDIYVLSKQVVHKLNPDGVKAPAFFVPGLLVSSAEIPYFLPTNGVSRLDIGNGLSNPIVLLRQSWQGYIPISVDPWR